MSVPPSSSSSSALNGKVIIAIVVTASVTLVITTIFYFFCHRYATRRQKRKTVPDAQSGALMTEEFRQFGREVKGLAVDENGKEILYLKGLECNEYKIKSAKIMLKSSSEEEELKGDMTIKLPRKCKQQEVETDHGNVEESVQPNEQLPVIAPPLLSSLVNKVPELPETTKSSPLPPPPPPPPIPPPIPPLPAPLMARKKVLPPLPPPMASDLVSSVRPPPVPRDTISGMNRPQKSTKETSKDTSFGQMKLKPLHWDKVIANADHSMVWNEISDGSLRFDDDQIELLFGYKHGDRKTPRGNAVLSSTNPSQAAQIFILEPRKSQNIAIILKSIEISRNEILDALLEGHGLTTDTLEKLTRIAPAQEEESKILRFSGDPSTLANAEGFLYYILKALPSAFVCMKAMLFRSNYDAEILHFKESLQTLELGCKELRTRGLFLKLLEAVLKAGNRMNAGTSRGNAQGFNLTALRKLSDVKSTDGKTTLLHFVVEQVARSEGRHSLLKQKRNLDGKDGQKGTRANIGSDTLTEGATETDKECLQQGLQALGRLCSEFSNVKKAAAVDYDCFINTYSSLATHAQEIRLLITNHRNGEGSNFVREMKGFLEECEEELKVVKEEQIRILELVKSTTKYYQAGATKHDRSCLQLFVIVKDFLDMVNKVCISISKNNKTKNVAASPESRSLPLKPNISPVRFPELMHLIPDSLNATSFSESDSYF